MSHWNYRLAKTVCKTLVGDEVIYEIIEAYYDNDGKLDGWHRHAHVIGDSIDDAYATWKRMEEAFKKEVVEVPE